MSFKINQQNGKNIFNIENLHVNSSSSDSPKEVSKHQTITQIKELLANGETNEALQAMKEILANDLSKQSLNNELIMFFSRYAEITHQEIHGLNSCENISVEKAKIVKGILDLISRMEKLQ